MRVLPTLSGLSTPRRKLYLALLGAVLVTSWKIADSVGSEAGASDHQVFNVGIRAPQFLEQWCSFDLSEEDVETYFLVAKDVDTHEFNADAIIAPCHYEGTITIDGVEFQWKLLAGGAAYLYTADESLDKRYLCKDLCRDRLPALK